MLTEILQFRSEKKSSFAKCSRSRASVERGNFPIAANLEPRYYLTSPRSSETRLRKNFMDLTRTAYGTWNGGRFMNYGEALSDERWIEVVQHAYRKGIRTFMTADVYGSGGADELIGRALKGLPRDSYCLVGAIGHDFYLGKREGSKGFPRFTNSQLRPPNQFAEYLRMATEKSLARCGVDKFDLLLLHNPDSVGYTSDKSNLSTPQRVSDFSVAMRRYSAN